MSTTIRHFALASLCVALCCGPLAAAPLWLSETSPHAGHGGGHHHGGTVTVKRGIYYKNLWLRLGATPEEVGFVNQVTSLSKLELLDTEGKLSEIPFARDEAHGYYNVEFPMPKEGFYNAYATHQWVNGSRREVQIAKAEVLKHSCREGHDNIQEKMPPKFNAAIPLEIVRERRPKESFHSLLGYGDTTSYVVMHNGRPLPHAEVSITSAKGWSRQLTADSEGRVRYTMIRDYFPEWKFFQKRKGQSYLVTTQYSVPEGGSLDGKPYSHTLYHASYAGKYYPSPKDYESYAYGLSFGTGALVLSVAGIVLYRRRRNRPYREVRFDE